MGKCNSRFSFLSSLCLFIVGITLIVMKEYIFFGSIFVLFSSISIISFLYYGYLIDTGE